MKSLFFTRGFVSARCLTQSCFYRKSNVEMEINMDFPIVYAVKHKELDVRMASRSGGIFTAVSDVVLEKGGIVYGCVLDEKFEAFHVRATTKEERNRMRGSKYIQSNMADTFRNVKADLEAGRKVLFSGTSCQVAGLLAFLRKDYGEQLFCMDILCHGVPSPLVWKEYLQWQEEKNHGTCVEIDFRNKKDFGWDDHVETLKIEKGDGTIETVNSKVFRNLFYSHKIIRLSCYKCPYKDITHPSDITIGDFWRVDNATPNFDDNKGVSLVLLNTEQGLAAFEAVKENLDIRSCRIEDSMQVPLKKPFKRPEGRDEFWRDFGDKPFDYIAKKYGHYRERTLLWKIRTKFKKLKKKFRKRK